MFAYWVLSWLVLVGKVAEPYEGGVLLEELCYQGQQLRFNSLVLLGVLSPFPKLEDM